MGLAASQARLLSITSRMADNELRAQIINNAKMRLTEDTQKASDKYISALNKTQYMMSNKDTVGNSMYQQLTFNNLTAYSSYNNQYGLINKSGQIVVSELDAAKFETAINNANNDPEKNALEEFLLQYGIEKASTSYWKNPAIPNANDLQVRYEGDMEYDDNANRTSGLHYGYEMSKTSTEVMVYDTLMDKYKNAENAYNKAVIKGIKDFINGKTPQGYNTNYENYYNNTVMKFNEDENNPTTIQQTQDAIGYLDKFFDELVRDGVIQRFTTDEYGNQVNTEFYNNMQYYLNEMIQFDTANGTSTIEYPADIRVSDNTNGGKLVNINGDQFILEKDAGGNYTVTGVQAPEELFDENGNKIGEITYTVTSGVTYSNGEYSFNYNYTYPDENNTIQTVTGVCKFTDDDKNPVATTTEVANAYDTAETVKEIYQYFQQNYYANVDKSQFANLAPTQYNDFKAAALELSMFIFGNDIGEQDYENLDDMEWIINSGIPTTNLDSGAPNITLQQNINGALTNVDYPANFEAIKDIYLIEQMIAQFGAPKYTWIDKNNPNENADAKAQWYTNLFEKMQESGYQKIGAGLTKSPEWIQYALESGLLSMVQVNDEYQWVSTMYSNCSDITEDTIEIEITRAEAEYKRETQKIQAKDKRFDMELKNIDTEHNSLQSEYESIKSVIDKNVQRHFKLFA